MLKYKKSIVVLIFLIVVFFAFFDVGYVEPPGISMFPTIVTDDKYLILKYWISINRLDLVISEDPTRDNHLLLKRIVGVPEDVLEIKQGNIIVGDFLLNEPYIKTLKQRGVENYILRGTSKTKNIILGKDFYFLMGDNRDNSYDSRNFGPIHKKHIRGKVVCIFWPLPRAHIF